MQLHNQASEARVASLSQRAAAIQAMVFVAILPPAIAVAYLVKSALGINLMAGPSPLHNLLYHFVR